MQPVLYVQLVQVSHYELVQIINARVEEIFGLVVQEIKRSGYDGLLPAGMVLTGGTSSLPGIRKIAGRILGVPVRLAKPENIIGLSDRLNSPAFSTGMGLLRWATMMREVTPSRNGKHGDPGPRGPEFGTKLEKVMEWLKSLLP